MKIEDLIPIGTYVSLDTGVTVAGYDQGCVLLRSETRGIRIMEVGPFVHYYAKNIGPFSDSYIPYKE